MRYLLSTLYIFLAGLNVLGQDGSEIREGKVSYITTQSVYVRFSSMEHISEGDTLYIRQGNDYIPALQIKNLSSISCVCRTLGSDTFEVSDAVYARPDQGKSSDTGKTPKIAPKQVVVVPVRPDELPAGDSLSGEIAEKDIVKQEIHGRLSVSSYSNFSSNQAARNQRMRYTFSTQANNLGGSGFSAETYLSFAHTNRNWEDIKSNIFNGLKIYNLSMKYDFNETMNLSAGRKINPMLSSVGAIDGLQFEKKFNSLTLGAIAGSRPDY